jgi:hypothetical protein
MERGLKADIEDKLREVYREKAEEIIKEAVKRAVADFDVRCQSYFNPMDFGMNVNILLEDKRTKNG